MHIDPSREFIDSFDACLSNDNKIAKPALRNHCKEISSTAYKNLLWQKDKLSSKIDGKQVIQKKILKKTEKEINKRYYCLIKGLGTKYRKFSKVPKDKQLYQKFQNSRDIDNPDRISHHEIINFVDSYHEAILLNPTEKIEDYPDLKLFIGAKRFEKIKDLTGEEILKKQLLKERMLLALGITSIIAGAAFIILGAVLAGVATTGIALLVAVIISSIGCFMTAPVKLLNVDFNHLRLKKLDIEKLNLKINNYKTNI